MSFWDWFWCIFIGISLIYAIIDNLKYRNLSEQEIKELELSAIKQNNIKKFSLRRKPKLLKFYKNLRNFIKWFCNILYKILIFILKAIGIIIAIIIICHLFNWTAEHPMGIIIFLLILILLKK